MPWVSVDTVFRRGRPRVVSRGRSEGLQGGTRGAPSEQQPLVEAELDHSVLPAPGVREAEDGEGEIPEAPRAAIRRLYPCLIIAHTTVIGRCGGEQKRRTLALRWPPLAFALRMCGRTH